jgi:hypothetical protein
MPPPRWKALVEKSAAAYCAAIEIYTKPRRIASRGNVCDSGSLGLELLLKARLLKEAGNGSRKCDQRYRRLL